MWPYKKLVAEKIEALTKGELVVIEMPRQPGKATFFKTLSAIEDFKNGL